MLLLLLSCAPHPVYPPAPAAVEARAALLTEDPWGEPVNRITHLDQGWGPAEALWYYYADQGSVLISYPMFLHLEQADTEKLFRDPANLVRFRFLAQQATPNNPDALPIGMARHEDQLGLTCAACHTGQINYRGTAVRIDGAPALIDMDGFLVALEASLQATLKDEAKLKRFAAGFSGGDEAKAREALQSTFAWFQDYNKVNASSVHSGFGRTDAVGRIVNQAIRFSSGSQNSLEPNAPVSFPELWDAPRHDFVQWAGFGANEGPGPLGRNSGEVVGVFGKVEVVHNRNKQEAMRGYASTVNANEIVAMEESLRGLESPLWPEAVLGPIDPGLRERGQKLYEQNCSSCHALLVRDDPRRLVTAQMTSIETVGTDPATARNLVNARVPAGILEGATGADGTVYGAQLGALDLLKDIVGGVLLRHKDAALRTVAATRAAGIRKTEKQGDYQRNTPENPNAELLAYKARPLNGIWASSPYLHNGSVPNLYSLLLPEDQRPSQFAVGRWEYDPHLVGYVSDGTGPFVYDTTVAGNSNRGHRYGVDLSEADRWALVEYVKSL